LRNPQEKGTERRGWGRERARLGCGLTGPHCKQSLYQLSHKGSPCFNKEKSILKTKQNEATEAQRG